MFTQFIRPSFSIGNIRKGPREASGWHNSQTNCGWSRIYRPCISKQTKENPFQGLYSMLVFLKSDSKSDFQIMNCSPIRNIL